MKMIPMTKTVTVFACRECVLLFLSCSLVGDADTDDDFAMIGELRWCSWLSRNFGIFIESMRISDFQCDVRDDKMYGPFSFFDTSDIEFIYIYTNR